MVWQKNGTPDTLGSTLDVMTISDLDALKFNQNFVHVFVTGNADKIYTLDNNTNTDYATRFSANGGADITDTSETGVDARSGLTRDEFHVSYIINIDGEEKLAILFNVAIDGTGAGNAPARQERVFKVDTTTNSGQYSRIDVTNSDTGGYTIDSNLSALGTD